MTDKFIEWDRDRLVIAQGAVEGSRTNFRTIQVVPRESDSADTLSLVDPLRKAFASGGDRKSAQVVVVFPRQLVTVHRIQLPQVADSEIPDMLRLQASLRLTVPVESVSMDFTPLPIQPGSATRDVLLVTVPNDQVAIVRRTLSDSGLELSGIRVSAYCVAHALARAGILNAGSGSGLVDIVAVMRRDFIELTFLKGTAVVFSHSGSSWTTPDTIEKTIRAELSRARLSAAESLGEHKIGRVILVGAPDVTSAVSDQISARMDGAQIERIDPAAAFLSGTLPDDVVAADMVTLAGAVSGLEQSAVASVDLINPRKAPEKKDLRRTWALLAALACLLIFAGGYFWRKGRMDELNSRLGVLNRDNSKVRQSIDAGKTELERAEKVGDWVRHDIEWLDELVRLKAILPGTDRMFIDNVAVLSGQRAGTGTLRIEGYAKSDQDISELARKLRDAGYGLKPYEPEPRASAGAQDYGVKIVLELSLPEPADGNAS